MSRAAEQQIEFHARLPPYEKDVRLRLTFEEAGELELALEGGNRAEIARELGDLVYVCYGSALVWGVDLDIALEAVHEANMRKPPVLDRHGKVRRPKNHAPPDMSLALR